jgi:2-phospho-L-lactate/phosphoenolpyruvate guanylyltransferase
MRAADVWAVVVARTGPTAKSRLSQVMTPTERQQLARAMLRDVLTSCRAMGFGGVVVITETDDGRALARAAGAHALDDPGLGLNAAVRHGTEFAARDADAVLVLPGDVPLVEPSDVEAILTAAADTQRVAVVVPDTYGRGTNALLLRPPHLIAPAFGEQSCQRHLAAAQLIGIAVRLERPRLALDVDEPDALAAVLVHGPTTSTAAARLTSSAGAYNI